MHSFLRLLWNGSRGPENLSLLYTLAKFSVEEMKVHGVLYCSGYQSKNGSPERVTLWLTGRES